MPALAAILVVVAYNMSEWRAFVRLLRSPKSDVAVLLVTFLLTVFIDLTVAIQVGVVLAAFLFLQRTANLTQVNQITDALADGEEGRYEDPESIARRTVPPGVEVFELYGPLFFGAVERFNDAVRRVEQQPRVLVLRMRDVHAIDASGLQSLEELRKRNLRKETVLVVSDVHSQPLDAIRRSGLADRIGRENIVTDIDAALARARALVAADRAT